MLFPPPFLSVLKSAFSFSCSLSKTSFLRSTLFKLSWISFLAAIRESFSMFHWPFYFSNSKAIWFLLWSASLALFSISYILALKFSLSISIYLKFSLRSLSFSPFNSEISSYNFFSLSRSSLNFLSFKYWLPHLLWLSKWS